MNQSRKDILLTAWDEVYDREGWYPPLKDALKNVDLKQAEWKATGKSSHSILELVTHILFYKERFLHRLQGTSFKTSAKTNDDTFTNDTTSNDEWEKTLARFARTHIKIRVEISKLAEAGLDKNLPDASIASQVLDLALHDAYHTGQIVQLRKLYGSWQASRDA